MTEQLAYLNDPLTLEFEAKISRKTKLDDGQFEVILEKSYFYPTGGGQDYDTGSLGEARVVDVFKDDQGNVVHKIDRDISGSTVTGKIDYERRLGHMQHHSAQHIVSRAFEALLDLETLSAHISADTPSTVDLPLADLSRDDLERVERFVNGIIFENRPIKSYFITDDELHTIPLRRPPKVEGRIRIVEVDSFDYSACGGTHCPQTGMIGLIKLHRTEIRNQKLRVHFIAGQQALRTFQNYHHIVTEISRSLSAAPDDAPNLVNQQAEQLRQAQKEIRRLTAELLPVEAQRLVKQAEAQDGHKLIMALYRDRPAAELRELGKLLQGEAGVIAVLAGFDGQKVSLIVACADDTGVSARAFLAKQLDPIGGKGGGDARMAQGGGPATEEQMGVFFNDTRAYVLDLVG